MRRGIYRHSKFQGPFRGPNLLVDGDCEAVGVSAWIIGNATATKQTTDPYKGVRNIRVVKTASSGYLNQTVVVIGKTYRLTGVARSYNGNGEPWVYNGAWIWDGGTSTVWHPMDITFVAGTLSTYFYTRLGGAGSGVEWDDLYLSLES